MKRKLDLTLVFLMSGLMAMEGVCGSEQDVVDGVDWSVGVKASNAEKYTCLTGELTDSFWEYPASGLEFMRWQSAIVPENLRNNKVTFIMAAGMGCNFGDKGFHELLMNGRKILEINTPYEAAISWKSELATAKFETVFIDVNNDLFGIFSVTVNPEVIEFGKRQSFEMKGKKCLCQSWFSISKVENLRSLNIKELQSKNTIGVRIAGIKAAGKAATAGMDGMICAWYWDKDCAVSIINDKATAPKGDNTIIFNTEGKKLPDDANAMADKAENEKKWLIEVYPESARKSSEEGYKKHLEYLGKLDCVIWKDSVEKVGNYIKLMKSAKVIKDDDGKNHIKVSLIGFPEGFKSEQSLTAIIILPPQTWEAKAFCDKQEIRYEYVVFKEKRGIKFDILPGGKPVDIYYRK
ncbi:MAG: hypothetical protein KJ964_09635 [Verrucomicrobia bacterium]|nr:hypothetical protein [Verrucomicrobiota bacterium]MBU1735771.1 hypothetical protein [Verrucomicrobiota bacterium]MBU1855573.1 hypothetical protein [Verrucomicrobiota bacterium]